MGGKNGDERKANHRYHPYERKVTSGSSEKENSSPPRPAAGKKEKIMKKISKLKEGANDLKKEGGLGGAGKLEEMRKQLCPKEVKISLERLHCKGM